MIDARVGVRGDSPGVIAVGLGVGVVALALAACGTDPVPAPGLTGDGSGGDDGGSSVGPDAGSGGVKDAGSSVKDATTHHDASPPPPPDAAAQDVVLPDVPCKRGIGSNVAPGPAFARTASSPGISWWYDWGSQPSSAPPAAIDFVPMIWGKDQVTDTIPSGSSYLLGFNEPNFKNQSNMSPQQAADAWPGVEAIAQAQGIPIVAPAVNFCGSAQDPSNCADPSVTDPYAFLKQFFADCSGCKVDAIAVHWYNCDLPSLQAYIDGSSNLEGFLQFNKPIWLTEFSCGNSATVDDQKTYMQQAVAYLEANPRVARYSWFSATPIPNAVLVNADGSATDLGNAYLALPQHCH
jgi:hypothetical protein